MLRATANLALPLLQMTAVLGVTTEGCRAKWFSTTVAYKLTLCTVGFTYESTAKAGDEVQAMQAGGGYTVAAPCCAAW